ncbi:HAMP domain-containing sensor histidine kinase [Peptococcaceae bacterium 1198_IL3148]
MKNSDKKIPLQRYWITQYLITLVVGLVVVAIISALWIRHSTLENRLNLMEFMAEETANRIVNNNEERMPPERDVHRFLVDRGRLIDMEINPFIYIVNPGGKILFSNRPPNPMEQRLHPAILNNEDEVQRLAADEKLGHLYVVKKPIETASFLLGYVVFMELEQNLSRVNQEYRQLAVMIISLALLGWAAIYFLSGRLSKPIKQVAAAARQVEEGDYNIDLPSDVKEAEVYELINSFKEMSQKLKQLETLRTELLAGVTHELKTPVTSISGLLQAVNDGVVEGAEAKEFLEISLKETAKIKKMVEDLLAFNTFAANAVPVTKEIHSINRLVRDCTRQWQITQDEGDVEIAVSLLDETVEVKVDPIRFQQIITNLLNNAKHVIGSGGTIEVSLGTEQNHVTIDVTDTGIGIPEEEQAYIFERFYRGANKKYKVGGLGLGLPFSKMIAQSLGGDLELRTSSPAGTTFRVSLPKAD